VKELEEVRDKYGDARRTQIVDESAELQLEDLIADEQVAVTVSHQGYLKRTPISIYRQQRRGGTGRMGMKTREEDFRRAAHRRLHARLSALLHQHRPRLLAQGLRDSRRGRGGQGQVHAEPARPAAGENVRAILPVRDLEEEGKFIFFATRKGTVKKTPLKDFSNVMARGIIAIGIDKDDELVAARITDGSQIIFLATHLGMAIRFDESDVRSMGRPAYGVRGIDLAKNDYVVGVAVTPKEHEPGAYRILAVTENGFGKRTDVEEYRLQTRGGKGVKNMAVTAAHRPREHHSTGRRHLGADGHQPVRQDHPHRHQDHPRRRPRHARRAPAQPGAGRQGRRRGHHSARRAERQDLP
jgi:DNA gyrase subunit A